MKNLMKKGEIIEMSDKNTYNFEFWPSNEIETPTRLSFDANDVHCSEFHQMCKAFAVALGYAPQTVEKYFGPDRDDWLN